MFVGKGGRRMRCGAAFVALVTGLLAACGAGTSYPIPAHEVTGKLLVTKPPMFVFGSSGADVMVTQGDGGAVRWTVLKDGKQVLRMVATVTPEGEDASRVAVAIEPPNNDGNSAIGRKMADNPAIVRLYKSAMAEQIDAKLNNRAFNMAAIQGEMMGAALASMPKIQEQAAEAARSSAEMERQMKQNAAEAAYEREHRAAMAGYGDDGVGSAPSY
jgi:hypothetical protein